MGYSTTHKQEQGCGIRLDISSNTYTWNKH